MLSRIFSISKWVFYLYIDVFTVWITHSNEVFEFMRSSNDDIIDGDKIDDTNEEVTLDANIFQHKVIALIIAL